MDSKFVRVATAIPEIKVGDCGANAKSICKFIKKAHLAGADFCVFPELCITGATCGDLFHDSTLLEESKRAVGKIIDFLENDGYEEMIVIVGAPIKISGKVYNCALAIQGGEVLGIVPKSYVGIAEAQNQDRWFESGLSLKNSDYDYVNYISECVSIRHDLVFKQEDGELIFAIEVGSDFFAIQNVSSRAAALGASLILNPACIPYSVNENPTDYSSYSKKIKAAYVHVNAGFGESSSDYVFSGYACINENGEMIVDNTGLELNSFVFGDVDMELLEKRRMKADFLADEDAEFVDFNFEYVERVYLEKGVLVNSLAREINPNPFIPANADEEFFAQQLFQGQILSLIRRLKYLKCETVVLGVSGGLDSTIALMVCVEAFRQLEIPSKNIHALTMPGFGTSDFTYENALKLIKLTDVTFKEISIREACEKHFEDIGHDINKRDLTYENAQARERTQILFDYASTVGGIVIGTGDLSEAALGWCTFNGDNMSGYNVNAGITKTCIKMVLDWYQKGLEDEELKRTILNVIDTPISPELLPADDEGKINQKTEDIVGPYELHEFFLYHFVVNGFNPEKILFLAVQCFGKKYEYKEILNRLIFFIGKFFSQQYKRAVGVDGPALLGISLSPREGFNFPSDISSDMWVKRLCNL